VWLFPPLAVGWRNGDLYPRGGPPPLLAGRCETVTAIANDLPRTVTPQVVFTPFPALHAHLLVA